MGIFDIFKGKTIVSNESQMSAHEFINKLVGGVYDHYPSKTGDLFINLDISEGEELVRENLNTAIEVYENLYPMCKMIGNNNLKDEHSLIVIFVMSALGPALKNVTGDSSYTERLEKYLHKNK